MSLSLREIFISLELVSFFFKAEFILSYNEKCII